MKKSKRILSLVELKMDLLLQTAGMGVVIISGIVLSVIFSRFRKMYWAGGYLISAMLIALLLTARWNTALSFAAPFSWVSAGRVRFVVLALAITMGLLTPLSRLPRRYERCAVAALAAVFVLAFSLIPFLAPAWLRGELSNLETRIGSDGVCLQTRNYTCGPAAAVTALRALGFRAQEGEIAVLAHSSPMTGTLPRCLYSALHNRYGPQGLTCRYRHFDSVAQLKGRGVTLAIVKDAFLNDHCVAILEVSDETVIVADPAFGKQTISHADFAKMWRFTGIVLQRNRLASI